MSRLRRKEEHIITALKLAERPAVSGFSDITFVHNALPEAAGSEISTATQFLGKKLQAPVIINAMTGGGSIPGKINEALATAARETGVAMAVGSQTVAADNQAYEESFRVVRKVNPHGLIMANVGANVPVEVARRSVTMIEADALQVHLNVPQETVMPEGDTDFRGWLDNIAEIVSRVEVPVIAKEVGFGLSRETAGRLSRVGIRYFDVGGRGGTNFIAIEDFRGTGKSNCLESWGIPTAASIVEIAECGTAKHIIATGGIRNGLDAAKSLALGADLTGVAGICLKVLFDRNVEGLIEGLNNMKSDLKKVMHILGVTRPSGLKRVPLVITGKTREWLVERGIDTSRYARRTES